MSGIKIKICGLYRDCDIDYVNEAGPDYAGFVFYPPSHRNVTKEQVRRFRERLSDKIQAVGVFVNAPAEQVAALLKEGTIQVAQLHGQETENYMKELRQLAPGCEIWKAYRVASREDLQRAEESSADRILLDNGYGTGHAFDWELAKDFTRPFLLAGGLKEENILEALWQMHPAGVDISSGVETERKKDLEKIKAIIEIIRNF